MSVWTYDYANDVGPNDEGFWEWYTLIKNGEPVGKADDEETAKEICDAMNRQELKGKS